MSTAGNVKLLLPPRQSRGNSYWGLAVDKPVTGDGRRLPPRLAGEIAREIQGLPRCGSRLPRSNASVTRRRQHARQASASRDLLSQLKSVGSSIAPSFRAKCIIFNSPTSPACWACQATTNRVGFLAFSDFRCVTPSYDRWNCPRRCQFQRRVARVITSFTCREFLRRILLSTWKNHSHLPDSHPHLPYWRDGPRRNE